MWITVKLFAFMVRDRIIIDYKRGNDVRGGVPAHRGLTMRNLSDEMLLEAYEKALYLRLSDDFIAIIRSEVERRSLTPALNH